MPDDLAHEGGLATATTGRMTNVRWLIVGMLFVVTTVNYADRATIAIAGPVISKDLGLDAAEMGFIFSAFGWAYVIAQLPGGWLLDRYGSKIVYAGRALLASSPAAWR
jgi:ACS family glucarate transporter-like MFS transporter